MNFILVFSFFLSGFNSHDIQVAFFKLYEENDKISFEIKLEKDDVNDTFKDLAIELNDQNIKRYIAQNLNVSINDEQKNLSFDEVKINDKHVLIKSNVSQANETINSVAIRNTCLLNIENHSNIIEIRLNNKERDFLMNHKRTSIDITY